jgi:hypothetical protein
MAVSNGMAGCLGLFLGPFGCWSKGYIGRGVVWLLASAVLILMTGGIAAPFCWLAMGWDAYRLPSRIVR